MRVFRHRTLACDRARQAASLRLDAELSQLENALLERHLHRCATCAEFAADVKTLTTLLRTAPPVPLERPIELPLRRRVGISLRGSGAWVAAASAAAAALLAVVVLPAQRVHAGPPTPQVVPSNNEDLRDLRILRQAQMMPSALLLQRQSIRGPEI